MRDTRNPFFVVVMSIVTLGLYLIYWHFPLSREIRSFEGDVPTAWLQLVPFVNLYFYYRFIDEAVKSIPSLTHTLPHVLLHVFFPWISVGLVQHRVNEYYRYEVQTNDGSLTLHKIADIVDDALQRGQEREFIVEKLRERGVEEYYINEAFRIENRRNGYY